MGFRICEKNLPSTHRSRHSRDTAHAQWLQAQYVNGI